MNAAFVDAKKRRDKISIIAEILEIAKDGTLKTQIMYKANLSFTQLNEYLKFMINTDLLNQTSGNNNKEIYFATSKGLDFLKQYYNLSALLVENDLRTVVKVPPRYLLR